MANAFKEGDVVQLKSGGPHMTVTDIAPDMAGDMKVYCTWFGERNEQKHSQFKPATLDLIQAS